MDTKSGSKTGSKTNLNESTLPLLEEQEGKGDVPEKIELETKNANTEDEKKDQNETKDKKEKKKKEKKEKIKKRNHQTNNRCLHSELHGWSQCIGSRREAHQRSRQYIV